MYRHPVRNPARFDVERRVVDAVGARIGVPLRPRVLDAGDGVTVDIDGVSDDNSVLVEVNCHRGPLRGSHSRKLIADAYKLAWAGARLNASRLILAVVGTETHSYLHRPNAWLSAALRDNGIEIIHLGARRRVPTHSPPPVAAREAATMLD